LPDVVGRVKINIPVLYPMLYPGQVIGVGVVIIRRCQSDKKKADKDNYT